MATAIVSVMTWHSSASKIAMTGEITLRGRVIAGLKEKLLATLRAHQNGAHSRRERQGSCRNRGQHQDWARDRSGAHGRGARPCDDAEAGADRVGGDHDHRSGRAKESRGATMLTLH
jgi:Lon protease (S16) C-terminal proteolytic domain